MTTDQEQQLLSEKHLAKRWGISFRTLQRWRWLKVGPSYVRIGGRIRYSPESIKIFEEERKELHESGNQSFCPKFLSTQKQLSV